MCEKRQFVKKHEFTHTKTQIELSQVEIVYIIRQRLLYGALSLTQLTFMVKKRYINANEVLKAM
jgi:hypothetical protein